MKKTWKVLLVVGVAWAALQQWGRQNVDSLADLHTCPACYGQTLCTQLTHQHTQLTHQHTQLTHQHTQLTHQHTQFEFTSHSSWKVMKLLNVKNVYYGKYGGRDVVLKKLADDSELADFDNQVCKAAKQDIGCNVSFALKKLLSGCGNDVHQVIARHPEIFETADGVRCNHSGSVQVMFQSFRDLDSGPYHKHHFLTLLAVNIEPLVMMSHHPQYFPRILGSCGRVVVQEYVGPTLSQVGLRPWLDRARYALQLLEMARKFSSGPFMLYLTDVSLDNFAVDVEGRVKIIDAENIVIVDAAESNLVSDVHVNDGFGCADCLSFSYDDLCGHTQSDHNFYAICKGMLSSTSFSDDLPRGLLHTPPAWVTANYPQLFPLVEECAHHPLVTPGTPTPDRRQAAHALHDVLLRLIQDAN